MAYRNPLMMDQAQCELYLFSAKGAAFIASLGHRPRKSWFRKTSALKARIICRVV
jgi:hypothetical protein